MTNSDDDTGVEAPFIPERLSKPKNNNRLAAIVALVLAPVLVLALAVLFFVKTLLLVGVPAETRFVHASGLSVLNGNKLYAFGGHHEIEASAAGYQTRTIEIDFEAFTGGTLEVALDELPGQVTFVLTGPDKANLLVDGKFVQEIDSGAAPIPRGRHQYRIEHPRYLPAKGTLDVAGLGQAQTVEVSLTPNWRSITLTSQPSGASVFLEQQNLGQTPLTLDLAPGLYVLAYNKEGYGEERQLLEFELGAPMAAKTVALSPVGGTLGIVSDPTGGRVFIDGNYVGVTPLAYAVAANRNYSVRVEKDGYDGWAGSGKVTVGGRMALSATLKRQYGTLKLESTPASTIIVDGREQGQGTAELRLPVGDHAVEFRKAGYRTVSRTVPLKKDDARTVAVKLVTEKEARYAEAKPAYTNSAGVTMVLAKPSGFTMGAPRGEPGQMANEVQHDVRMDRWFYIGNSEISYRQFGKFLQEAGKVYPDLKAKVPGNPDLPVTGISWDIAALYCNWLSAQEGLPAAYQVSGGQLVLDPTSIGYRLPTEAEWEWSARVAGRSKMPLLKYPWGTSSVIPAKAGNFADKDASSSLPYHIPNYSDGFQKTAPVKSFEPNAMGLYDLGGNVSEWVHDFYGVTLPTAGNVPIDPTGPDRGIDHVVRGSSWKSGNETELRFSFRTFSEGPADHIGFRIGRWVN